MITTKTCISQWEHVVQELEQIVEGKRQSLEEFDYSFGRTWLEGLERGLEHARQNLEKARNAPFFLMLPNSIPIADSQSTLLYAFMDVIVDDIDSVRQEEKRLDAIAAVEEIRALREKVALTIYEEPKPAMLEAPEPEVTKEVELYIPAPARHYTMMDGVKQWIAGNKFINDSWRIVDEAIAKYWKTV